MAPDPLHLYQIWISPEKKGLPPSYDQKYFEFTATPNRLIPVASNQELPEVVHLNTDATISRISFDSHLNLEVPVGSSRGVFIYLTSGEITINGEVLRANDQARIIQESNLQITAIQTGEAIFIEIPI